MTRTKLGALALVLSSTSLVSCTTMGGNIKGSFSCVAPDGICAPSSTIDDRALAMIAGEDGDRMITPAGPYNAQPSEGRGFGIAAVAPARRQERVLRIVFPAQIDAAGRLHEQTAVHAVVERGDWQRAVAGNAVATTPAEVASATGGDTLLGAVDRSDASIVADPDTAVDPDMPSPAAVAAAAARAHADPVGDIKDQVARQLARAPRRVPVSGTSLPGRASPPYRASPVPVLPTPKSTAPSPTAPTAAAAATGSPKPLPASSAPNRPVVTAPTATSAITVPAHATNAGRAAIAPVSADPAIRASLARGEPEVREAAKDNAVLPTLRAPSFPGVDQ